MMNNTTRATSPSSGQHNARPIITCGICFSILTEPVTFGCSHSFCTRCVRTRLDKSGVGDGFTCPLCNQVHQSVSVRNLQEFADVQLADRIARMSRGEDARPMCQWCEESPASLFCNECQYTLCSDCNVAVHKNAAKRGHAPAPLGDGRTTIRNATRKCDVRGHEEYRLEFYCVKCEELCCAYCLQIAPHRGHESMLVSKAAQEVRQRMGRDLENLGQVKANIESMANELNRVHGQYLETYDHVESLITDRFNAFRHQLVQREVEVRKILQNLRDNGDAVLCQSRLAYMLKLNNINEAGITFRRLQHGGADFEVLQNRSAMSAFVQMSIPTVVGTGFRLSDLGDLNLAGLAVSMDLHSTEASGGGGGASQIPLPAANSTFSVPPAVNGQLSRTGSQQDLRAQRRTQGPAVFTFGNDPDVEITPTAEGTLLKCNDSTPKEAGVHTRETFESLKPRWSEFNGKISWKVRLDLLRNGFIGVVETDTRGGLPNGFHWQPMIQGSFDCTVGRVTPVCKSLPVCKPRDVITFTYDTGAAALSIGVNGIDRGVAVTNVHSRTAPCFILSAGEVVTMIPA